MSESRHPHSERRLRLGLERLGLDVELTAPLMRYLAELEKWNATYNLSGIKIVDDMVLRHLLDSLTVLPALPQLVDGARLIDVGSGAGIPGLILAIARPGVKVTTLDSAGKKARFMRHAIRVLGLNNAEVFEGRAEDHVPEDTYDFIISRAFASLSDFVTVTEHLAGPDSRWLAMKAHVDDAERAALPARWLIEATTRLPVPGLDEMRQLLVLRAA
ncbi:MAG: 16S rRNA (guanine(527)-N(7))-methyltransferase RsmG [Xanthomonadaceae bacterium]|nr:16S rRNA (guanine(527)-N(7))-methyltransferase RsmG [Xanthomonadaceae bacterium]